MKTERLNLLLVTGLGVGLLPKAPGTWGSALAAGLWLLAAMALRNHETILALATAGGVLVAGIICVALGPWAIRRAGNDDPHFVVIDEFAGQWLALLAMTPVLVRTSGWPWMPLMIAGLQLALFRLFDILKPPPCRRLERLPAGWGILADDLMAGAYAGALGCGVLVELGCLFLRE